MGKRHFGHSFGKSHGHHSHHSHHGHHKHDLCWDYRHPVHDLFLFGTPGKDGLVGTDKSEIIVGYRGNDDILGNGGNDWIGGGRGGDTLNGGAGFDKVFGGKGDDVVVHSLAENAANEGCGKGDFYDGGKGHDVLRLVLTAEEAADEAVQADIQAFEDFLANNAAGCGRNGNIFKFESFNLAVRNFEELKLEVGDSPPNNLPDDPPAPPPNTPPVAAADPDSGVFSTLEDSSIDIDVLANDSDPDGDPLHVAVVIQPTHGLVEFNPDGTLKYTPEDDYFGPDSFSYQASDGKDLSQAVGVDIEVLPVNDKPELIDPDDPLVWVGTQGVVIPIDIVGRYAPGPANESDGPVTLVGANFGPESGFGMLLVNVDESKISYLNFGSIPDGREEIIEFSVRDDTGAVTLGTLEVELL